MTIEAIKMGPKHLDALATGEAALLDAAKRVHFGKDRCWNEVRAAIIQADAARLAEVAAHLKSIMENDNATS